MERDTGTSWLSLFALVLLCGLVVAKLVVTYGCRTTARLDVDAGVMVQAEGRCGK